MQTQRVRARVKKAGAASKSTGRSTTQSQPSSKDINSSLVQRALDLVHEGQLTAGVAIKLFGIPRSTFYKKLSMCNQQPLPLSTPDQTMGDQYYPADEEFGIEDFGSCSGDIMDNFVGTADDADSSMTAGQWASYDNYYAN